MKCVLYREVYSIVFSSWRVSSTVVVVALFSIQFKDSCYTCTCAVSQLLYTFSLNRFIEERFKQNYIGRLLNSAVFRIVIMTVILLNSIVITVQTDKYLVSVYVQWNPLKRTPLNQWDLRYKDTFHAPFSFSYIVTILSDPKQIAKDMHLH